MADFSNHASNKQQPVFQTAQAIWLQAGGLHRFQLMNDTNSDMLYLNTAMEKINKKI